jgi:hypothetical protein
MSWESVHATPAPPSTRRDAPSKRLPSASASAPLGAGLRPRGALTATSVLAMQRAVGNQAVRRVLPRHIQRTNSERPRSALEPGNVGPTAQRSVPTVQRARNAATIRELERRVPTAQANARLLASCANLAELYTQLSVTTTDLLSVKLQLFALNYDQAYRRYSTVIGQGRAEAQNQTLWRGIFLGIGTGVLAGLAAAYIAPSAAAGWFTLTLADAATAAGSSFLQATASSVVAVALADAITTRGSDLQPSGLSPDVLRTDLWRHVASMYRGAVGTTRVTANLHRNALITERLIAEMRVHVAGGATPTTAEDILRASTIMSGRMDTMAPVIAGLRTKVDGLQAFSNTVRSYDPNRPDVDTMEDDIWVMWIGSLGDEDSDILDLDAIEDHLHARRILGSGSRLGVDFGGYTSEADELAAIAAGRREAAALRQRYTTAMSRWTPPEN